jgi:hypothetical protein
MTPFTQEPAEAEKDAFLQAVVAELQSPRRPVASFKPPPPAEPPSRNSHLDMKDPEVQAGLERLKKRYGVFGFTGKLPPHFNPDAPMGGMTREEWLANPGALCSFLSTSRAALIQALQVDQHIGFNTREKLELETVLHVWKLLRSAIDGLTFLIGDDYKLPDDIDILK